jgi:hypothetical protein
MVALITCFVLFVVAALTVDLGNTWARRGSLQSQADQAAKLAAEQLPVDTTAVPSSPTAAQLKAAKAAAYYLACHPVSGQSELAATIPATIPDCPAAATYEADPGIDTFAKRLLANGTSLSPTAIGSVSFPTVNQVKVTSPSARIDFTFGKMTGAESSVQTKSATAIVLSPGELMPVGMSLTCLANAAGAAPLGVGDTVSNVMPINYISSGYEGQPGSPSTPIEYDTTSADFSDISQGNSAQIYNNPLVARPSFTRNALTGSVDLSFTWAQTKNGFIPYEVKIWIRKAGYALSDGTNGSYYREQISLPVYNILAGKWAAVPALTNPMNFSIALPAGNYEALVQFTGQNESSVNFNPTKWASGTRATFTVLPEPEPGDLNNFVSCARPMQSPRLGISGDKSAMIVNIAQGLDHGLAAFPGVTAALDAVTIAPSTAVPNLATLLSNPSSAFACANNTSVKLDYPTRRTDGPNCFHVHTGMDWSDELTKGLLTGATLSPGGSVDGRLKCPASGSCNFKPGRPVLSSPGGIPGSYNDDHFGDFILTGSNGSPRYLSDPFFMALDALVSPSLPVVTPPNDTVDPALYSSPRFFWAPVAVTAYTTKAAGDYPILTFRPVFLTSDTASSQITTPIDTLLQSLITQSQANGLSLLETLTKLGQSAACILVPTVCHLALLELADITSPLTSLLDGNVVTVGGLVIDKAAARVRAARIMTVAPGALPAVPRAYDGPTTDYLGVGPKIVRLVQ